MGGGHHPHHWTKTFTFATSQKAQIELQDFKNKSMEDQGRQLT